MHRGDALYLVAFDPQLGDEVEQRTRQWPSTYRRFAGAIDVLELPAPTTPGCILMAAADGQSIVDVLDGSPGASWPHPMIGIVRRASAAEAVAVLRGGLHHLLVWPADLGELAKAVAEALLEDGRRQEQQWRSAELTRLFSQLSAGEREVLRLVMRGYTNKAIARELHIGQRTVESRRASLLRKMRVDNVAGLAAALARIDERHSTPPSPRAPSGSTGCEGPPAWRPASAAP